MAYERVTYRPEGARRSRVLILDEVRLSPSLLVGRECDESGETRWFKNGTTERIHAISLDLVERREILRFDPLSHALCSERDEGAAT